MTYLAEMSVEERKSFSKEELRNQLDREERRDCFELGIEFEPISDEKLEKVYNNIQNER